MKNDLMEENNTKDGKNISGVYKMQTNSKNVFSYYFPNYEHIDKLNNENNDNNEENNGNNGQLNSLNTTSSSSAIPVTPKYNLGRFFVIKSIDEDNIHKSIKYKIWCSTTRGNQKLAKAFSEAKGTYPIYLFYSVNGSGRFLGVAQMMSDFDSSTNFNYWSEAEKWRGFFFVNWIIIKDVPNKAFKHLLNEYNENRPVTSSRDTQEISLLAGLEMFKIFKEYLSESSILDDFEFYEKKQFTKDNKYVLK